MGSCLKFYSLFNWLGFSPYPIAPLWSLLVEKNPFQFKVGMWLWLYFLPSAVDLAHFTRVFILSSDIVLSMIKILCPPTWGRGHYVFGADPVSVSVWLCRCNLLSALYLLNEWMDFDQTYTDILLDWGKMLIRFYRPWLPFSKSHEDLDCWKMACLHLVCILSWRNGWILT